MRFLFAVIVFPILVECRWRESFVRYKELRRQLPFLPHYRFFGNSRNVEYYGDDDDDSSCDIDRLRACVMSEERLKSQLDSEEESTESGDYFERTCRVSLYTRACIRRAGCATSQALHEVGFSKRKAAIAALGLRINAVLCKDPRFTDNNECINRVFSDYKRDFEECAEQFEELIENEFTDEGVCEALTSYSQCAESLVRNHCGASAGEAICHMIDEIAKELDSPEQCNLQCSTPMYPIGRAHHILSEPTFNNIQEDDYYDDVFCDAGTFKKCSDAFKKELHIKGPCVFAFLKELKELVDREGRKGFEAVCRAGKHFNECGGGQVCDCFNIDVMQSKLKLTQAEAIALNITVFVMRYECSHEEFDKYFDCMHTTSLKKKEVLWRCERRLREEIKKGGIPCKAGQMFMECVSSPFKRACGLKAGQAICQLEMSTMLEYGPHMHGCHFHCDI